MSRDMSARLVPDRWKLDWRTTSLLIARGRGALARLSFRSSTTDSSSAVTLLVSLALVLLFLLTGLPLFSDLFEFCSG